MPIAFAEISTLLARLENIEDHDPPIILPAERSAQSKVIIESWFKSHRRTINELSTHDAVALLSSLLPERRSDRVYGIQSTSLCRILSRSLGLRHSRARQLEAYRQPGNGDLAACLARVVERGGPPARPLVNLAEVDELLDVLAGNCRFSNVAKTIPRGSSESRDEAIGRLIKRMDAVQSKWLIRLILKDFSPVRLDERIVLQAFHFLLPDLLRFQEDFAAAIKMLKGPLKEYPENPDPRSRQLHRKGAAVLLKPSVGIKVGRPDFHKARSIDHCIGMCRGQRKILERKYDGEYCEVHIDMSWSSDPSKCIKIFSKSGKDSTEDRRGLRQTLVDCLRLGKSTSKVKQKAILLGELVVYSDKDKRIMPFEVLRKYVTRSGIPLGTDQDSQRHAYEHLAIVFFDLLILDDEVVMRRPLRERRMRLREVYSKIEGRAMGAEWKIVDFGCAERAKRTLIQQFAASIADRTEGLVLKPCDAPYFDLEQSLDAGAQGNIKLKKDYIAGMGDEADFAIVGGTYNSQQALKGGYGPAIKWTHFHLGCLLNKDEVLRFDVRPHFRVVGTVQADQCIPRPVLHAVNSIAQFCAVPYEPSSPPQTFDLEVPSSIKIDHVFNSPFVFEILGSGFAKPSDSNFLMLRHPRVKKLHQDRTWRDCVSFRELQALGEASRSRGMGNASESQEMRDLVKKLEGKCRRRSERLGGTPDSRRTNATSPSSVGHIGVSPLKHRGHDTPSPRIQRVDATSTPSTSALDGTTLTASTSPARKRKRDETLSSSRTTPKRQKLVLRSTPPYKSSQTTATTIATATATNTPSPKKAATPLRDITNSAPQRSDRSGSPTKTTRSHALTADPINLRSAPGCASTPHICDQTCPWDRIALYIPTWLTARLASAQAITLQGLVTRHDILLTANLEHWDRDSFSHAPLAAIVAESQAYEGRRKVVLVDARLAREMEAMVDEILGLNGGGFRESVEIWDLNMLDSGDDCGGLRKGFLGAVRFDTRRGRAGFERREV